MSGMTAAGASQETDSRDRALAQLRAIVDALAADPVRRRRVAAADVTVELRFADDDTTAVLVLRDGDVALHTDSLQHADVALDLTTDALERLVAGEPLAIQIADGRIGYRGVVRRFLRVEPILRDQAMVVAAAGQGRAA